jgi:hypothetical protein
MTSFYGKTVPYDFLVYCGEQLGDISRSSISAPAALLEIFAIRSNFGSVCICQLRILLFLNHPPERPELPSSPDSASYPRHSWRRSV